VNAVAKLAITTAAPASRLAPPPLITCPTRESLLPGETATTVRATTSAALSAPSDVANPAPAITSGMAANDSCSANARAWLKPSP